MTPLEIAANALTTVSIFLAARNSVYTWPTGIAGCILFALVFYQARLYADVALQAFFVVTSVVGWLRWRRGDRGGPLAITRAGPASVVRLLPLGLVAALAHGALLHHFTDAYAPYADSLVLAFSVIAQILLMQRRVETWPFWLLVNSVAVPLFISRELYLTAVLYSAYWVNAIVAWRLWLRAAEVHAPMTRPS